MTDEEFLQKFADATLPNTEFKHQAHIRMTWLYLKKYDFTEASQLITQGIKNFATANGAAHKYHETLTRAWIQLVADGIAANPTIDNFTDFIKAVPELLDKNAPLKLYSQTLLDTEQAKHDWLKPDQK